MPIIPSCCVWLGELISGQSSCNLTRGLSDPSPQSVCTCSLHYTCSCIAHVLALHMFLALPKFFHVFDNHPPQIPAASGIDNKVQEFKMWLSPSNIFTANRVHVYSPLESTEHKHIVLTKRRRLLTCGIFAVLGLWSVGLLAASYSVYSAKGGSTSRPYLYTPMEDAIEYEVRHFNQGLWGDRTTFMGSPNATNHEAWRAIRRLGIIKLSSKQASRVPGPPSIPYPGHPDVWQGGIEMFHQLHCLYHLRMLIYAKKPEVYYGRDSTVDEQAAHTGEQSCSRGGSLLFLTK